MSTEEETKCGRCDGCGKIADSDDGEPWSVWLGMPLESSAAVLMGLVKPIACPVCNGTGKRNEDKIKADVMERLASNLGEALDLVQKSVDGHHSRLGDNMCVECLHCDEKAWSVGDIKHALDCKAALLLRKHGRKVRFQGEP